MSTQFPIPRLLQEVNPSATLQVSARAAELRASGQPIISLSAGEPDFDTPQEICQAAVAAIAAGQTRYTAVDGTMALKEAILARTATDTGLHYQPQQVIVSNGAKQSIYNAARALLEIGDEAIIPAPYWVSYPDIVRLAGGRPVIVSSAPESGFKLTADTLAATLTARSRLLFLNSPQNPSGAVYSRQELQALGEVIRQHPHLAVLCDDIYQHIYWGDDPFCNLLMACPDLADRTVIVNGVSKAYAMTGWRIGYALAPVEWVKRMKTIQSQSTSNACAVSQAAAVAALTADQGQFSWMCAAFKDRHDQVLAALQKMPGIHCQAGQGAFYLLPDFRQRIADLPVDDDISCARYLLEQAKVALVPGSAFGANGHLRLSFASDQETLNQALSAIERILL